MRDGGGRGKGRKVDGGRKGQVAGSLYLKTSGAGLELAGNSPSNTAFLHKKGIDPVGLKEKWESG